MFNGFSAIELLIKIVSAKLPAFEKLADDAQKEFCAMKAAQQSVHPTNDGLTHADNESTPAVISG